ncbi:MAG: hypothetical protein H7Y22_14225 [Gemmatimonadaceae bacterium]|nr:hypothetical protein [Gloeobacterales cyanobacterium ES-bin-141]
MIIQPRQAIPSFEALSVTGELIKSEHYRQRWNLLLVFLSRPDEYAYLGELANRIEPLRASKTRLIAFVLEPAHSLAGYPFPVIVDPTRRVYDRLGIDLTAVVLTDQFGEIHKIWWLPEPLCLPTSEDLLSWAEFIDMRCR